MKVQKTLIRPSATFSRREKVFFYLFSRRSHSAAGRTDADRYAHWIHDQFACNTPLEAQESSVSNCRVASIGGTTVFPNAVCLGIKVYGLTNQIHGDVVQNIRGMGTGEGAGICLSDFGLGSKTVSSHIENSRRDEYGDYGIFIGGNASIYVVDNYVINFQHDIAFTSCTIEVTILNRHLPRNGVFNYRLFGDIYLQLTRTHYPPNEKVVRTG